jgi:hypothetical protein
MPELQVGVHQWAVVPGAGRWVRIRTAALQITTQIFLGGFTVDGEVALSLQKTPGFNCTTCVPQDTEPNVPTVTFARRLEYEGAVDLDDGSFTCAAIVGQSPSNVLAKNVLSLRQQPPSRACLFDTFLWIPQQPHPTVHVAKTATGPSAAAIARLEQLSASTSDHCGDDFAVLPGSSTMDGFKGQILRHVVCIQYGHVSNNILPVIAPPPPSLSLSLSRSPPPPHPQPNPSGPPASPGSTPTPPLPSHSPTPGFPPVPRRETVSNAVSLETTLAGTIETFGEERYKYRLAAELGVTAAEISVETSVMVTDTSIRVVATIRPRFLAVADVMKAAEALAQSADVSGRLWVVVQAISPPSEIMIVLPTPSPPPGPPPSTPPPSPPPSPLMLLLETNLESEEDHVIIAILGVLGALSGALLLACLARAFYHKHLLAKRNALDKAGAAGSATHSTPTLEPMMWPIAAAWLGPPDDRCFLCCDPLDEAELVVTLRPCGHKLHRDCASKIFLPPDDNCPLCCGPLDEAELAVALRPCGHKLHRDCTSKIFLERAEKQCLICRGQVSHAEARITPTLEPMVADAVRPESDAPVDVQRRWLLSEFANIDTKELLGWIEELDAKAEDKRRVASRT